MMQTNISRIIEKGYLVCLMVLGLIVLPGNSLPISSGDSTLPLSVAEDSELRRLFALRQVDEIDSLFRHSARSMQFNGNVLVVNNNRILYQQSFGYSDFGHKTPLTAETAFQLASVSKQFTAIAILMLYQKQMLDLDDSLQRFIPELPYPGVTLRNLLNHTSGVPDYLALVENEWKENKLPDNEDLIRLFVMNPVPAYFSPGARFAYSNTGYALLASVIERVSGLSFTSFLRRHIFTPLQMQYTFTATEVFANGFPVKWVASGHRGFRRRQVLEAPTIHDHILGDKGVFSSTGDLFRWDVALSENQLLSSDIIAKAYSPAVTRKGKEIPYGFGFRLRQDLNQEIFYHHGTWQGFRTSFIRYPQSGNAIIILNNVNQRHNNEMIEKTEALMQKAFNPDASQRLILSICDGVSDESVYRLFDKLTDSKQIILPDSVKFHQSAWLLAELNKPYVSKRILEMYATLSGLSKPDPLLRRRPL